VSPRTSQMAVVPPLPNTPSWRGAQFRKKHRDKFTFYHGAESSLRS
jgi:hypothetical protein